MLPCAPVIYTPTALIVTAELEGLKDEAHKTMNNENVHTEYKKLAVNQYNEMMTEITIVLEARKEIDKTITILENQIAGAGTSGGN